MERKSGGSFHPRLDIEKTPIVKKYREGKMKRTSKGGLKLPETVEREPIGDLFAMLKKLSGSWLASWLGRNLLRELQLHFCSADVLWFSV